MLRLTVALVLVVGLYFVVPVDLHPDRSTAARLLLSATLFAILTALVVWQVRIQITQPDRNIDGLLLALIVGVLGFSLGFYVLELRQPGQIVGLSTRVDALYFTMATVLTIGYGDVHAAGQAARILVLVQMVYNVVVIASGAGVLTSTMRQAAAARVERQEERRAARQAMRATQTRRTHRKPT
ncbi:hypothetical protein JCM18899A_31940 [Nocardioides sp. AN3]